MLFSVPFFDRFRYVLGPPWGGFGGAWGSFLEFKSASAGVPIAISKEMPIWDRFWVQFKLILGRFRVDFGLVLLGFWFEGFELKLFFRGGSKTPPSCP